jgi:hypothetical protein
MVNVECPYCGFTARSKGGLTQHIDKTPYCSAIQKESLSNGVVPGRKKPPPAAKRPLGFEPGSFAKFKPTEEPWSAPKTHKRKGDPLLHPPPKAAKTPQQMSHASKTVSSPLSPKELAFLEKQINAYTETDAELWAMMEQDTTRNFVPSPKSRVMDSKMPASASNNGGSDDDDFQMLDGDNDDNNILDDNSTGNNNPADVLAQGYQLNEHVLPGEEDFNNDGFLNIGVNTQMRQAFKDYCDKHMDKEFPALTEHEARGIRLLDIMKRKRCSLDTYDEMMLWHYRENGTLDEFEGLKDVIGHVSRDTLLTTLKKRYNMEAKFPVTKPTTLPYSLAEVKLVCHDAWGCFESLLSDPRLTDDDFLFFNNDPLSDPPENIPVISDLNTGRAFREAHKLYKKKPNQIPLPVTLYMDGANTGQMKNMPITAVKMSLGIFT